MPVKKIAGYSLLVIASLGYIFFRNYKGQLISNVWLWYFFFLALVLLAVYLIFSAIRQPVTAAANKEQNRKDEIRKNSEKIRVDFDNCEFGDRSFKHKVAVNEEMETINLIVFSLSSNPADVLVPSSYLAFKVGDELFKAGFTVDLVTLKSHVISGRLFLFVDRLNRSSYYFNIK